MLPLHGMMPSAPQQPEGDLGFTPRRFTHFNIHILVSFWLCTYTETKWSNLHFLLTLYANGEAGIPLAVGIPEREVWSNPGSEDMNQSNLADLDASCVLQDFTDLTASSGLRSSIVTWLSDQLWILTVLPEQERGSERGVQQVLLVSWRTQRYQSGWFHSLEGMLDILKTRL